MARIKNDHIYLEAFQKLSFRDDDGTEAASMYFNGDTMVFDGITISGATGPAGPAGTGVPGNYIGDEDNNSRVTVNASDTITMQTAGVTHWSLTPGGNTLIGHNDITSVYGKLNIDHTGTNHIVLDRHSTDDNGPGIVFRKARGARESYNVVKVNSLDVLGQTTYYGYDSTAFVPSAQIKVVVSGDASAGVLPSKIEFKTTATDWASSTTGLTITKDGGIRLKSGVEVNNILEVMDSNLEDSLVTGQAVQYAINEIKESIDSIFTSFSGVDLKMNRLFDPAVSGTEMKIEEDSIRIYNQGGVVGQWDSAGLFYLNPNGAYVNTIYDGSLQVEASNLAIPTAAAVKAYVDEFGGSSGYAGEKLVSDGGLSELILGDASWSASIKGGPVFSFWEKTYITGNWAGRQTTQMYFGDEIGNLPAYSESNIPNFPPFLFHARQGSRLTLYNKMSYGDKTLPYANPPGINIVRNDVSINGTTGSITWEPGGSITVYRGTSETNPPLPDTENEMQIRLGGYQALGGGVTPIGYSNTGDSYPGGILKLFCKLRFGNGRIWGDENPSDFYSIYNTDDMDQWGSYGNNGWVNRIASCHYTKPAINVGAKFYKDAVEFLGTGNDDHCLVTGKYVHTLVESEFENIKEYVQGYTSPTKQLTTGTVFQYGYAAQGAGSVDERELFLYSGGDSREYSYAAAGRGGAYFRSRGTKGNRIFLESTTPSEGYDGILDLQSGYNYSAPRFVFYRSCNSWYGDALTYGNAPIQVGDVIGRIAFIGQALKTGYTLNPCEKNSAYTDDFAITVFAEGVDNYGCRAKMEFSTRSSAFDEPNSGGTVSAFSIANSGELWFGNRGHMKMKPRNSTTGRMHTKAKNYPKSQLSGDLTFNQCERGKGGSIMFGGLCDVAGGDTPALEAHYASGTYSPDGTLSYPFAFSRIDGGGDSVANSKNNSGRLAFMIRKHNGMIFNEILRITGAGKVLIGDDDSGQHVDNIQNVSGKLIIAQPSDTYNGGINLVNVAGIGSCIFTDSSGSLVLNSATNGSRAIKLNSGNGTVVIGGTTDNSAAEYGLMVNGNIVPSINNLYNLGTSGQKWNDIWATNSIIQTSDRNQKEEIRDVKLGLNFVKGMKPRTFKRKGGQRTHYGFIAQELEDLVKKIGKSTKETAFIVKDSEGNYGLRDGEMLAILVKAIQELAAKVEG